MKRLFSLFLAIIIITASITGFSAAATQNYTEVFQKALEDMPILIDETFSGTVFPAEAIVDYGFVFDDFAKKNGTVVTYTNNEPDWYAIPQDKFESRISSLFDKIDYSAVRAIRDVMYASFTSETGQEGDSSCYYGFDSYRRGGAPQLSVEAYTDDGNGKYTAYAKIENSAVKAGLILNGSTVKICSWEKVGNDIFGKLENAIYPGETVNDKPQSKPADTSSVPTGALADDETDKNADNSDAPVTEEPAFVTLTENDDVKIYASPDTFPNGTFVSVIELNKGKSFEISQKALKKITESFYLYDISATYKGGSAEPNGTLNIQFDIPKNFKHSVEVYSVSKDGKAELLPSVEKDKGTITVNSSELGLFALCEVNEDGSLLTVKKSNNTWLIVLLIILFFAVVAAALFIAFKKTELLRWFTVKSYAKGKVNKSAKKKK